MDTKRNVLVILLVAALLSSMVCMASASSQTWYLTETDPGVTGAQYTMYKDSGVGTEFVGVSAGHFKVWVADESVSANQIDMGGQWDVAIRFWVGDTSDVKLKVEIGDLSGETFTPADLDEQVISGGSYRWWNSTAIWPASLEISNGEYLAIKVTNTGSTKAWIDPRAYPTNSPSRIISPSSDPGYPVPELSTIVLTSLGMLLLGGFVVYSRRRNNK